MNDLKVCWWPIDKLIAYSRNSRKIPERAIDKVAASIKEFGWRQAIVVDKDGVIICGHTRLLAAKKLGLKQVPVHVADNLTPAQVKAYRLMDNRSHEETDWGLGPGRPEPTYIESARESRRRSWGAERTATQLAAPNTRALTRARLHSSDFISLLFWISTSFRKSVIALRVTLQIQSNLIEYVGSVCTPFQTNTKPFFAARRTKNTAQTATARLSF